MPSPEQDVRVRAATPADDDSVLAVLAHGYGRAFTPEWLQWKHRDSPWGPSRCWIAEDDAGSLGVVFGLAWRLEWEGNDVPAWRLVDGATTPRAQRRGVFRRVVAAELAAAATPPGIVIATATPEARDAHVKNGAAALDPISSQHRPVMWRPAAVQSDAAVLESWRPPDASSSLHTRWDAGALRWRLDPRSGIVYFASRLAQCDRPHGVVHRLVSQHGLRTLVITAQWGDPADVAKLIAALTRRDKAVSVLAPAGPGAVAKRARLAWSRGNSLLCVWSDTTAPWTTAAVSIQGWALDGLTLEGVI